MTRVNEPDTSYFTLITSHPALMTTDKTSYSWIDKLLLSSAHYSQSLLVICRDTMVDGTESTKMVLNATGIISLLRQELITSWIQLCTSFLTSWIVYARHGYTALTSSSLRERHLELRLEWRGSVYRTNGNGLPTVSLRIFFLFICFYDCFVRFPYLPPATSLHFQHWLKCAEYFCQAKIDHPAYHHLPSLAPVLLLLHIVSPTKLTIAPFFQVQIKIPSPFSLFPGNSSSKERNLPIISNPPADQPHSASTQSHSDPTALSSVFAVHIVHFPDSYGLFPFTNFSQNTFLFVGHTCCCSCCLYCISHVWQIWNGSCHTALSTTT